MARKVFGDSLKNAMNRDAESDYDAEPKRSSPTIARAQASVLEEERHATRLLDPDEIRMSPVMDRLDPSDGIDELATSIRDHGQKVPVLVRRLPDGAFEIVFGRRRLLACRLIGCKVRSAITEMSDEDALIAQGVENNARQDPSFIERALFVAGIVRELGKTEDSRRAAQSVAYQALQIDETLVSRMYRIATGIPIELIRAIGPAHGVGRRIWEKLSKLCVVDFDRAKALAADIPQDVPGSERLDIAIAKLAPRNPAAPDVPANTPNDRVEVYRRGHKIILNVDPDILPEVESAIRKLIGELLDRGQDDAPDQ